MKIVLCVLAFIPALIGMGADTFSVKSTSAGALPADVDPAFKELLQSTVISVAEADKPTFEFVLARNLGSTNQTLDKITPATFLGVVVVRGAQRDYHDDELAPGTYTMRFALQPQDGNHLGTADYSTFAVLVPAKLDRKAAGITNYNALVKASGKETSTGHPNILNLRPVSASAGDLPAIQHHGSELSAVRVSIPGPGAKDEKDKPLVFEIVVKGKGKV